MVAASAWKELVDSISGGVIQIYQAVGPPTFYVFLFSVTLILCVAFWPRGRREK